MRDDQRSELLNARFTRPGSIAHAAQRRERRDALSESGQILIIAADHAARGVIDVGDDPTAMGNRFDLLDRLITALEIPGVDGVLGTPDIIEDLLLLGALEKKMVFGSMNRGGLPGTVFEIDDRFTAYSAASIARSGLDGGKMLLRISPDDDSTADTLASCAHAVSELASSNLIAMIEPFMTRMADGRRQNVLTPNAVIRSMSIASGLGETSSHTWLKVPVVDEMDRVAEASTLPIVLLGGSRSQDPDEMFRRWQDALRLPGVRGLAVGRNLLYPANNDVAGAVKTAVSLL